MLYVTACIVPLLAQVGLRKFPRSGKTYRVLHRELGSSSLLMIADIGKPYYKHTYIASISIRVCKHDHMWSYDHALSDSGTCMDTRVCARAV